MAIDVVDRLEPVKVHQTYRESRRCLFGALENRLQVREEPAAVGKIGKTVEIRQPEILVTELLRLDLLDDQRLLRFDQIGEITIICEEDEDHRRRHQKDIQ